MRKDKPWLNLSKANFTFNQSLYELHFLFIPDLRFNKTLIKGEAVVGVWGWGGAHCMTQSLKGQSDKLRTEGRARSTPNESRYKHTHSVPPVYLA